MDPITNPYAPGAGSPPPELAGRDALLEALRVAIERARRGLTGKSLLVLGLAGTGKTVLLDRMRIDVGATGVQAVRVAVSGTRSLPALLAPELRLALLRVSSQGTARDSAQRALSALAGFAKAMKRDYRDLDVGLDVEAESGLADSGDFQRDLQVLLESAAIAAQRAATALVLFFDDMHFLSQPELAGLITALHACAEQGLPIALVGTGLPQLRGQASALRTYTDRLYNFAEIGALPAEAAEQAIRKPAAGLGVQFEDAAIANMLAATHGHPYFLQELAKHAWDSAVRSPITLRDTRHAALYTLATLDENFFRPRFNRLTPAEKKYMRAMAELGAGPFRSGEIAAALNRRVTSLGPTRGQLLEKGMIWSPQHGETACTVPRFDEFLRRTWASDSWRK